LDTTQYLPDTKGVEVGSEAQEDLRYALQVLERQVEEEDYEDDGELYACMGAIETLRFLTSGHGVDTAD
jgi:hypothetical protein